METKRGILKIFFKNLCKPGNPHTAKISFRNKGKTTYSNINWKNSSSAEMCYNAKESHSHRRKIALDENVNLYHGVERSKNGNYCDHN